MSKGVSVFAQLYRTFLLFLYYVLGLNLAEAVLFFPTSVFQYVPYSVSDRVGIFFKRLFSAALGRYVAKDGKQYELSVVGSFSSFKLANLPALEREGHAFPSPNCASYVNAQIFQKCAALAYEDWGIVKDVLDRWSDKGLKSEFVGGYSLVSMSWEEYHDGDSKKQSLDLGDLQIIILKVNGSVILAFEGTSPFNIAAWSIDWDVYSNDEIGKYGRVHPGFRTALGLNKDFKPLGGPTIRTTVICDAGDGKLSAPTELNASLFDILAHSVKKACGNDPQAKVYMVGHSLGGALAAIFSTALALTELEGNSKDQISSKVAGVFTIGQPRIGDSQFASKVTSCLDHTPENLKYVRVINVDDIVPAMPPPGSADLGQLSYQHSGFIVYISTFGSLYPLTEQPVITSGLVVMTSIISALKVTLSWVSQHFSKAGPEEDLTEYPTAIFVLAKWLVFPFLFLPHGVVQHFPANYSLAINNSPPSSWEYDNRDRKSIVERVRENVSGRLDQSFKAVSKHLPSWAKMAPIM